MCFNTKEADIYRQITRTARAPRRCFECGQTIPRGAQYQDISSLFDGHWSHWATCMPCQSLIEAVAEHEHEEGCYGVSAYPEPGGAWVCAHEEGIVSDLRNHDGYEWVELPRGAVG